MKVKRKKCLVPGTSLLSFGYNERSELSSASLGASPYAYDYDNIGNRKTAREITEEISYDANNINQYTSITREKTAFVPTFDTDGNQTLIQSSTGIWSVVYNADNRPVSFTKTETEQTTLIECGYDYMGRRYMKKVTVNGAITLHHRYIYRGYLQIASVDLTRNGHLALWLTMWDPSEPIATRPLAIQKNATWYTYGHDLTKNVTELYHTNGTIATVYDYTPYGAVTATGIDQAFQWSSEVYDAELGMVYFNYRHYNPMDGRWIGRDPMEEGASYNLYQYTMESPIQYFDRLGLDVTIRNTIAAKGFHWKICVTDWEKQEVCTKNKKQDKNTCCHEKKQYKKLDQEYCIGFGPKNMSQMFPDSNPSSKTGSRYPIGNSQSTLMPPQMTNVNGPDANGIVHPNNDPEEDMCTEKQPEHLPPIVTSCSEDIKIKKYMTGQVGQTADYNLVGNKNNCRWYAFYVYNYVITNIINPAR